MEAHESFGDGQVGGGGYEASPEAPEWLPELQQGFSQRLGELDRRLDGRSAPGGLEDGGYFEGESMYDDDAEADDPIYGEPDDDALYGDDPDDDDLGDSLDADDELDDDELDARLEAMVRDLEAPRFEQEMRARLGEYREQVDDILFERLAEEFPEINDPRVAAEVAEGVGWLADRLDLPQHTVEHPEMARVAYLALKGLQAAEREVPVGPDRSLALEDDGAVPADPEPVHQSVFHELHADARAARANRLWQ